MTGVIKRVVAVVFAVALAGAWPSAQAPTPQQAPPQDPASFNLDAVRRQIDAAINAHRGR